MEIPSPARSENVQRQLAIFDVARKAHGRSLPEIKKMLTDAFARRGLSRQPGPWLDAVASEALYGEPYIVDLPAAVAADTEVNAADPQIHEALRRRRVLRASGAAMASRSVPSTDTTAAVEGSLPRRTPLPRRTARSAQGRSGTLFSPGMRMRKLLWALAAAVAAALVGAALRAKKRLH